MLATPSVDLAKGMRHWSCVRVLWERIVFGQLVFLFGDVHSTAADVSQRHRRRTCCAGQRHATRVAAVRNVTVTAEGTATQTLLHARCDPYVEPVPAVGTSLLRLVEEESFSEVVPYASLCLAYWSLASFTAWSLSGSGNCP